MGLEARIWALRLGFGPQDWDLGLETGIWASRMGFEGAGTDMKEKEKIPHMCESIGHRPLRGRCPKTTLDIDLVSKNNELNLGYVWSLSSSLYAIFTPITTFHT